MIVRPASRIDSAISFGVFCRLAPSTSAIIRSRKVSPGSGRDAHDDLVGEHRGAAGDRRAVAARLADDRRRLAGDGRLVDRCDAFDDVTVGRDHLARGDDALVADVELRSTAPPRCVPSGRRRLAMVSLRVLRSDAACALPRPSAIASAKFAKSTVAHRKSVTRTAKTFSLADDVAEVADEQDRRVDAADLDDEHHRVAEHAPRVELAEAVDDRGPTIARSNTPRRRAVDGRLGGGARARRGA